ncbi:MAG TPA: hypothetical protein VN749_22140 [Candidatus Eisenbacteria bacterium]|nr:hypothetical protein [Candidatus Eisenbacteria bacterium]
MSAPEKQQLERFFYWQGQRLRSTDFRRIAEDDAQRRWWHNRAMHNAWGIYRGLKATPTPTDQQPKAILLEPGLAYDVYGRELILAAARRVPVPAKFPLPDSPAKMQVFNLLMKYKEPACPCEPSSTAGCWPESPGNLGAGVEFCWRLAKQAIPVDGVVLGKLRVTGGKTRYDLNFVPVRSRPFARPLLASGATIPGSTPWQPWTIEGSFVTTHFGISIQTAVDTSLAGFTSPPCYFAWLEGPLWSASTHQFFPAFFPSLANESTTGFAFRLLIPMSRQELDRIESADNTGARTITRLRELLLYARRQKLYVAWIGCQMQPQVPFVSFKQGISNLGLLKQILTVPVIR